MRPIDADAMLTRLEEWNTSDSTDKALYNFTLHRILEQPTVDSVEVVRCKDCKHYDLAKNGVNGVCSRQYGTFDAYDFCSYGERK